MPRGASSFAKSGLSGNSLTILDIPQVGGTNWFDSRAARPNVVSTVWSAGSKPLVPEGAASSDPPPNFKVLSESDIDRFVGHYRQAALNAVEAGFDGVEIHGANGYVSVNCHLNEL